jgi:hypothetical protein
MPVRPEAELESTVETYPFDTTGAPIAATGKQPFGSSPRNEMFPPSPLHPDVFAGALEASTRPVV